MAIENPELNEMGKCGTITKSEPEDLRPLLQSVDSVTDPNSYVDPDYENSRWFGCALFQQLDAPSKSTLC